MLYLHPKSRVVYPVSPVRCLTLQLDVSGWAHTTSRDDWQILNVHEMAAANKQCDCVELSYSGQAVEDRTPHFWHWILLWERVLSWPRTPAHDLTWFFTNRNYESNPNWDYEKSEVWRHHSTKNSNYVQRAELLGGISLQLSESMLVFFKKNSLHWHILQS